MRASARVFVAMILLLPAAGCGDDEPALPPSSGPVESPTPPPADELKQDLLVAERELDTYRFAEGTYTAEETLLGPAFPFTVTVKDAGADSFYLAAYDDQGTRYVLIRENDETRRTCGPPDPQDCPGGEW